MGFANSIGNYQLSRTIGEGTFAKVKLAVNTVNGQQVAIKMIDKQMIIENNLISQANVSTFLDIWLTVIGTKTKIYIVMEYVAGGQLSDKMPGTQLSTACGSPSYVAPEVRTKCFFYLHIPRDKGNENLLANKGYDGAAADVWSCGVILFELLAGFLPFDDRNLINLYRKISKAEYKFPEWFTNGPKMLIYRILDRNSKMRMTTSEIIEDQWFQINYEPAVPNECGEKINMDDINAAFDSINVWLAENETGKDIPHQPRFINAFQLIAMSHDLDLSRLFEEQASIYFKDNEKQKKTLGSKHTVDETIEKVKAAAKDLSLSVERMNNSKMKMLPKHKMTRCSRSCFDLSAEVIEVAPTHCVIEISKSAGELGLFKEFCKSLSSLLIEESDVLSEIQEPTEAVINRRSQISER
ncbi:hypothetical protein RJ640_015171 [Escallonia rubra]|uniref:non-specific serine/threonine protein kinase n=1 Tax=Escallonia rubra TaxID=112253 RepID=A0AA88RQ37_9ASTE|nr:hypothetical protein RJ640_015171 [Escallonia rubra]